MLQLCELFGVSTDYLVRDEEQVSAKSDQNAKTLTRLTREREKIRYRARRFYYIAWVFLIMGITYMLAYLMDSRWACFGSGIGQFISTGIVWILYSRDEKKIEKLNEEIEGL